MYAKSGNNKHVSKMTEPRCPQCGYSSVNDIPRAPLSSKRFQKLLSTNECLTGEEKCIFNDFVEDGQSRLSDLDARIALVGNLLEGLKKAKEELETALTERKKILHPMRSIPEELLLEIFKRGLGINDDPEDLFRSEWHSLDLSSAPWVYGHVSRRWRVLSMNSPVLWTRIKVSKWPARRRKDAFGRSQVSLQTSVCSPLVAYLARSRSSPVAVHLNLPAFFANRGGGEAPRSEEYTAISSILLSHAWRWRSLHLVKSDSLHPLDSTLFSIDTFPSLTNLTTEGINYGMSFSNLVAPQLRSWETIGKPSASFPVAALSAIQYYSSSEAPGSDLLQVVALLPNIRTLCVQSLKPFLHTAWSSILVPTLLIGLTKLEIKPSASASLQSFLNNISCPSLQSLCMGTCDSLLSTTIQSFEMRSRFHLKYWGFTSPLSITILSKTRGLLRQSWHILRPFKTKSSSFLN
ncbi:hypothetical protein D9757_011812 [Collybiopsis confluens]|uniref:F-box domain-containing protein n=1 Tax=Collybiopsis confluens TaxID=2823264 RepID=A0A8H5GGD0_9AGAR|nr:hypothetical protein D9757_011812 [Collybiopsis confluens]